MKGLLIFVLITTQAITAFASISKSTKMLISCFEDTYKAINSPIMVDFEIQLNKDNSIDHIKVRTLDERNDSDILEEGLFIESFGYDSIQLNLIGETSLSQFKISLAANYQYTIDYTDSDQVKVKVITYDGLLKLVENNEITHVINIVCGIEPI